MYCIFKGLRTQTYESQILGKDEEKRTNGRAREERKGSETKRYEEKAKTVPGAEEMFGEKRL